MLHAQRLGLEGHNPDKLIIIVTIYIRYQTAKIDPSLQD